jgi:hypothetical protein
MCQIVALGPAISGFVIRYAPPVPSNPGDAHSKTASAGGDVSSSVAQRPVPVN